MYYSVDEFGNIIYSENSDILPEEFQSLYPESALDTLTPSVSSGDIYNIIINEPEEFDYDYLIDVLANVPGYTIYPSTQAVSVLTDVLNGVDQHVFYVILSGSDTNDTSLYYSNDFNVSGKQVTLLSPVTHCRYYSYRPSSSSSYVYTYTVESLADTTFTFTNQLAYTNTLSGYPDVIPYKQKENYSLVFAVALGVIVLAVGAFKSLFGRK